MNQSRLFNILRSVDSTNNYAMARVHEGMAKHGMAWFAMEQTAGKGQRGKLWHSNPGEGIILSMTLQPSAVFAANPYYLSATIGIACSQFLEELSANPIELKWPNDLYWRDRKTGGILIENSYAGKTWNWAVVGVGINLNQEKFPPELPNPVSIIQINKNDPYDSTAIARKLHIHILEKINMVNENGARDVLQEYNSRLYRKGKTIKLKKDNAVFSTTLVEINSFGQLITMDSMQRAFNFGEVEWLLPPY